MSREAGEQSFVPREHGATAMLLTPFVTSAVLARAWLNFLMPHPMILTKHY